MAHGLWRGRATLVPWSLAGGTTVALVRLGAPEPWAIVGGALVRPPVDRPAG